MWGADESTAREREKDTTRARANIKYELGRSEEFAVEKLQRFGLRAQRNPLKPFLIETAREHGRAATPHYRYQYDEAEMLRIAHQVLSAEDGIEDERVAAAIAIRLPRLWQLFNSSNPDPWELASTVAAITGAIPRA
jgi:hypothetical protein